MSLKVKLAAIVAALASVVSLLFLSVGSQPPAHMSSGSAVPGNAALVTTSIASKSVGPDEKIQLFSTSTCASRIVTTSGDSDIRLSLSENGKASLSSTVGVAQLASTTVAYDSGLYGCGRVDAYAFASSTVTVVELQ